MFGIGGEREKEWAAFEPEAMPLIEDVFRVAKWLARNREEAEDLTQETFAQALKSFVRYTASRRKQGEFLTFRYKIPE